VLYATILTLATTTGLHTAKNKKMVDTIAQVRYSVIINKQRGHLMFYIYEKTSTYIMGKMNTRTGEVRPDHRQSYKTMPAAKAALTRMSKRYRADLLETVNDPLFRYGIAEAEYFHKTIEKSRTRTNIMNNEQFSEKVNTPGYLSPASESYWSM